MTPPLPADRAVRVDAHHHFWEVARGDYGWLEPGNPTLYRDYGPADLEPLLDGAGVDLAILVQAAPTVAETRFLLEIAGRWSRSLGVVGWFDMTSADAPAVLAELCEHPRLLGMRPMLQSEQTPGWLAQPPVLEAARAVADQGRAFDALARADQLPEVKAFADANPGLTIILDHAAKPAIRDRGWQPWARDIAELSHRANVVCKLSGLLTEAGAHTDDEALAPYVDHLLACFGPQRLMWGSDWPVLNLAGDYIGWARQCERLLALLSPDEQAQVFGRTALAAYRCG